MHFSHFFAQFFFAWNIYYSDEWNWSIEMWRFHEMLWFQLEMLVLYIYENISIDCVDSIR